jgi:putative ABC transport system permease protein
MTMEIRPILASLQRHRIPALLIVLEMALACAVLCNAIFMIGQYITSMHAPNNIDEAGISVVSVGGMDDQRIADSMARDLAALRAIAGVNAAAAVSALPLGSDISFDSFTTRPNGDTRVNTSDYLLGSGAEQALGLHLLQGRYFTAEEYANAKLQQDHLSSSHVILINESDARRLWPGENALGKQIYSGNAVWTIVGIVADVLAQDPSFAGSTGKYSSVFFPQRPSIVLSHYVLRSAPQDRDRVLQEALQVLGKLEPGAVLDGKTYEDQRAGYFADTRNMAWTLVMVCVVMLAVTALGIVGLTSFWVGQRRRQIGIRRAIGASRGQILQYFQTENFLLSAAGVLLGVALGFAINIYLMQRYEVSRMPWYYLGCGAAVLWLLGQCAVLGPALRAAAVPPVVATRST